MDGEGTIVVRRVMDADNSCLFNAVGYVRIVLLFIILCTLLQWPAYDLCSFICSLTFLPRAMLGTERILRRIQLVVHD